MRLVFGVIVFIGFVVMTSLYIAKEDGSLDAELKGMKHQDSKPLIKLHEKFEKLDIDSESLNLEQALEDIHQAIKEYPLDDKLKMIKIELENKRANELK